MLFFSKKGGGSGEGSTRVVSTAVWIATVSISRKVRVIFVRRRGEKEEKKKAKRESITDRVFPRFSVIVKLEHRGVGRR